MAKLTVSSVTKSFGGRELFTNASLEVGPGTRMALVGPNGCGKSTLLRIMAGVETPSSGTVSVPEGANIGYAAQDLSEAELDRDLLGWVLEAFASWSDFWVRYEAAVQAGDDDLLASLGEEQARMEASVGYNIEHKAEAILAGLGFSEDKFHKPMRLLSGGWRERAKLARVILKGADILFLDEPTNHLDLEAIEWLENYVLEFSGALVIVVHDRRFLDTVATHVCWLGGQGTPTVKRGNFTQFLAWREEDEETKRRQAAKLESKIGAQMDYVRRFRVKARKAAQAQSKLKQVDKMREELATITFEQRAKTLDFSWPEPVRGPKAVATAKNLTFAYAGAEPLWPSLDFVLYRGQKVAISAPNGAGKSTLFKLLVGELEPTAGTIEIGARVKVSYFSQHHADIVNPNRTVLEEIRRLAPDSPDEHYKAALGLFLLGESFFERQAGSLSGGERARLVLSSIFMQRASFLILDEPTNHLDMESREALISAIGAYEGTVLMVAHDRYLLEATAEVVWELSPQGITEFLGGWERFEEVRRERLVAHGTEVQQADPEPQPAKPRHKKKQPASKGQRAATPPNAKLSDKERKRREAEVRNDYHRRIKPLKDRYTKLENELDGLATEQAELEGKLADPAMYADTGEFMRLTTTYQQTKKREEELMGEMVVLEEEIAAEEQRRDKRLASI